MRKYLISNGGNFYKANLHVHTNISDGLSSPEEIKAGYKSEGYSVVAFTDHEVFVPQNQLTDDEFLALNSVEIAINDAWPASFDYLKTYHFNLYAKTDKQTECAVTSGKDIWCQNSIPYATEKTLNNVCPKFHSVSAMNDIIEKANNDGFLVCYNHPVWSLHNFSDYSGLKGLWGIEVYNSGSAVGGYEDTVQPFEDLLRENQNIVPVCADDTHRLKRPTAYGGFTMIKADKLSYDSIISALERGDCYSSTGPEIKELYIENGVVNITTSEAVSIKLITDIRYAKAKNAVDVDSVTNASFDLSNFINVAINNEEYRRSKAWFRLEVIDKSGKRAYSKAYFINDIFNK